MGTVVLDTRHYLTVPEERIPKIKSVLTLQGGRVVHGDLH